MTKQLYLGGGGSEHDEAALWDAFLTPGQRIVLLPLALPAARHPGARAWLSGALAARGDFHLEMWSGLEGRTVEDLQDVDVLFVSGGNTFALLDHLQRHAFLPAMRSYVGGGGVMYGGSAGAIITGADISLAEIADANEVGVTDTTGLDLLGGLVVHPHFVPAQTAELRERAAVTGRTVLALPERGGVVVTDDELRSVGPDTAWMIGPDDARPYAAGESWPVPEAD
ncbi:MAG TPA: Type 1 glutamine amidotransferase-like domain-containing protein [Actinopolymorphaceae bacterium]